MMEMDEDLEREQLVRLYDAALIAAIPEAIRAHVVPPYEDADDTGCLEPVLPGNVASLAHEIARCCVQYRTRYVDLLRTGRHPEANDREGEERPADP